MSLTTIRCWMLNAMLMVTSASTTVLLAPGKAFAEDALTRKVKTKIAPDYPELARRMNLVGTVRLEVVVAVNGSLKNAKVVGGHPVLATAAMDAIRRWKFEPAAGESTGTVEFRFNANGQ
ncbi:MAG: energy transducer TonB [Acidobacteriaceae bacterium]